jgi:hypothetical protein
MFCASVLQKKIPKHGLSQAFIESSVQLTTETGAGLVYIVFASWFWFAARLLNMIYKHPILFCCQVNYFIFLVNFVCDWMLMKHIFVHQFTFFIYWSFWHETLRCSCSKTTNFLDQHYSQYHVCNVDIRNLL